MSAEKKVHTLHEYLLLVEEYALLDLHIGDKTNMTAAELCACNGTPEKALLVGTH